MSYSMQAQIAKNREEDKFRKLQSIYRGKSNDLIEFRKGVDTQNIFKKNQDAVIDRNSSMLNNLRNDILTLRRQTQIGENQFRKSSFYLFLLKNVLSLLLLSIIVALLVKNETISKKNGITVVSILALVMLGIIVFNFIISRNVNDNHFTKKDWLYPTEEDISENQYSVSRPTSEEYQRKCKKCPTCPKSTTSS